MLLGYKKRFAPKIENGSKIHTMRKTPKRMPKVGETLYMYTGLRTKYTKLISKALVLKGIQSVRITYEKHKTFKIEVDGKLLPNRRLREFFINDGFEGLNDFLSFWTEEGEGVIYFNGLIFHWTDFKY